MGESRQELLAWLNNLLQLNVTKVEQCGSGAAYCQIMDSIYLDVPMTRVKFNVNTEYGYIQNFKILQTTFAKHQIDRPVPVEALIKCKMQDNLEFLQWFKRYWDQYFPGIEYDAAQRRKGQAVAAAPVNHSSFTSTRGAGSAGAATARRPAGATSAPRTGPRLSSSTMGGGGGNAALIAKNNELQETVTGLERERDFYFNKLRQIEMMLQEDAEANPELDQDENSLLKRIQNVLYTTEEGFEIPADEEEEGMADEGMVGDENETF